MKLTEWVPFATAAATLLAALVAYAAARRTARTTWRSRTLEWRYISLTNFFDAAMLFHSLKEKPHTRDNCGTDLHSTWRRLDLTGPAPLVNQARPLYQAASDLFDNGHPLRAWNGLTERAYQEYMELSKLIDSEERMGRDGQHLLPDYHAARSAYEGLREAVSPGSAADWGKVMVLPAMARVLRLVETHCAAPQ
ncbi:hypothetical protein AQI95_43075 [Streptomyces yokosukanensis]|uniref:DUF4760 domain-containing protein n=1 Tax=Streptomyces yokosukanensis TaxID=67386 RepID=A0A101NMN9_9ACTN|nr:hypothetical protein [Streptomyces yokosukanensis]KUM95746.1 hypothetical protein AQI95_43075 [Streptomyces yokosukanensis]